jgi:hypothetical protein
LDLIKRFLQSAAAENWRVLPAKDFVQHKEQYSAVTAHRK